METIHYLQQDLFEWHHFFCIGRRPNISFYVKPYFFILSTDFQEGHLTAYQLSPVTVEKPRRTP
jgi:hypothetical protein